MYALDKKKVNHMHSPPLTQSYAFVVRGREDMF